MKRLSLFRHAKSGWDDPAARDFDRALNDRGRRAARIMGRHMARQGMRFDRILASPAVRVTQTLDAMLAAYGSAVPVDWDRRLYLASDATLLDAVRDSAEGVDHLMLAGHNPGLEDLALLLVPDDGGALRDCVEEKFPTAALATIALDIDRWDAIAPGTGRLEGFVRPRDLDPALGPER